MILLETLIELKCLNSSLSSLSFSFELRQAGPCRAIRGNSISVNSTLPPLIHPFDPEDNNSIIMIMLILIFVIIMAYCTQLWHDDAHDNHAT